MLVLLGDVSPTPGSLWDFLIPLSFVLNLVVTAGAAVLQFRNSPQKREIQFATVYATKEEVGGVREEIREVREVAEKQVTALLSSLQRLESVSAEKRAKTYDMIKESAVEMDTKMDAFRREFMGDFEGMNGRISTLVEKMGEVMGHLRKTI